MAKKFLVIMMAILIVVGCCYHVCAKEEDAEFAVGDIVEFGSYPQTEITDESLKQALNAIEIIEIGFKGYYTGKLRGSYSGAIDYIEDKNMMFYKDVTYNGEKYRGIKISCYRPGYTNQLPRKENSAQSYYGYSIGEWYWFKYEPLRWIVFDVDKGLALCEKIIDSQPYNSIYNSDGYEYYNFSTNIEYANDFCHSSLCKWLNNDFLITAFTQEEQSLLSEITVDTHFADGSSSENRGVAIDRQVVLLTYEQAKDYNSDSDVAIKEEFIFGSNEQSIDRSFTDYSTVQGYAKQGWWLVTPSMGTTDKAETVTIYQHNSGEFFTFVSQSSANNATLGVRPVISFSQIIEGQGVGNTSEDVTSTKENSVLAVVVGAVVVAGIVSGVAVLIVRKKK